MPQSFFEWIVFLVKEYYPLFLRGVGVTLAVSITGTVIGFIIGLGVALLRTIPNEGKRYGVVRRALVGAAKFICTVYVEVFRGTPMMVQAMVMYYGWLAAALSGLGDVGKGIVSAIIIISINTGAYMAEIVRGGIESLGENLIDAVNSAVFFAVLGFLFGGLPGAAAGAVFLRAANTLDACWGYG